MSSPRAYAWGEYPLLIEATASNGTLFRFLSRYKPQHEVIEAIDAFLATRERWLVFIKAEELLEESYDLLAANFDPAYILE